ncbi:LamG domain-containing protein [Candidatus Nanosalina sp. VS9-1]|uniref:LamG domain-containing protein n=1 Tax=Candidatus Nanosalina sp. VS9-1 TaxID=3388566 RepID=UPI0039E15572
MTLIGYWPLNENSGKAYDHSGNDNHGTVNGGVTQGTTGLLGDNAYNFNGSDSYVDYGFSKNFSKVSMFCWIYITDISNYDSLISKYGGENSVGGRSYELLQNDQGGIRFHTSDDRFDSDSQIQESQWHHVGATWDGNQARIFIDGKQDNSSQNLTHNTNNITWQTGRSPRSTNYTQGKISEVRIYNRPITEREVQYLYQVGSRGLQTTSKKTS